MSSQVRTPLFDRRLVRRHRERAARMTDGRHPLLVALAEEMADRLRDIKQDFHAVLQLGGHGVSVASMLPDLPQRYAVVCDSTVVASQRADRSVSFVVADEASLPFAERQFDLVVSLLGLSWMDDVQGHLAALKGLLCPGGLFMAAMAGGETFALFRSCLMEAELASRGGAGSRFSPLMDMASASRLLLQAGFRLPVVDRERCALTYPDVFALAHDLRGLGATAAHAARAREWLPREAITEAEKLCKSRQGGGAGRMDVLAELFFLHGWNDP